MWRSPETEPKRWVISRRFHIDIIKHNVYVAEFYLVGGIKYTSVIKFQLEYATASELLMVFIFAI